MALKFSLTDGQVLDLFRMGARNNLYTAGSNFNGAHIMNDLFHAARLVQAILAVAIVSAIVMAIQFSLVDF
jgi:hypothetical protein